MYFESATPHPVGDHPTSANKSSKSGEGAVPLVVHSSPRFLEFGGLLYELFCFSTALLTVVLTPPLVSHQVAIGEVLSLRISMGNLLTGALCVVLWTSLLGAMTSKKQARLALVPLLINRCLEVSGCAGIAMLIIVARRPAIASLHNAGLLFSVSLGLLLAGDIASAAYRSGVLPSMRRERSVLIVGCGWRGQRLAAELSAHPKWHYRFLGFIDSAPPIDSGPVLGSVRDLETILMERAVDEVMITLPIKSSYDAIQNAIEACERLGVQCRYSTDLFNTRIIKSRTVDHYDPSSIQLHMVHTDMARGIKRLLDITVAALGLLILSPLLIAITIAVKWTSDGPALFLQKRYGLNKRLFTIYKFRTMVTEAEQQQVHLEHLNENDGPAFKIKSDPRITRVGSFLRRTSLDELPQLWNVFLGDMSLVGPRPLPVRDVSRFAEGWLMRRFSVPPGITGLWQVSGRSNLSFDHWIKLDLDYIDRWSLLLDLRILCKTFPAVLSKDGAA